MKERIQALPIYRDGNAVIEEDFPVLEDETGETFVTMETALQWEARHKLAQDNERLGHIHSLPKNWATGGRSFVFFVDSKTSVRPLRSPANKLSWTRSGGTMPGRLVRG